MRRLHRGFGGLDGGFVGLNRALRGLHLSFGLGLGLGVVIQLALRNGVSLRERRVALHVDLAQQQLSMRLRQLSFGLRELPLRLRELRPWLDRARLGKAAGRSQT